MFFFAAVLAHALRQGTWRRPTLLHFYAYSCFMAGFANLQGFLPQYNPDSYIFYYASLPQVPKAALIYLLGSIAIFGGMWLRKRYSSRIRLPAIPPTAKVPGPVWLALLAAALFFLHGWMPGRLGLAGSFIFHYIPFGILFLLARRPEGNSWWLALGLAAAFTIYNVLYAFLRMEMILPAFTLVLGVATSGRLQLKEFLRPRYFILYAWIVLFIMAFPWMINNRGKYGAGLERIAYARQVDLKTILTDGHAGETVLTRSSLLNQLSQVARIADEDGFYRGKTLDYWRYVFIPRFLWPDKPPIASGSWFAYKINEKDIDRPYKYPHSWSANMTVPGELYLNFSWPGLLLGGLLLGWLAQFLWSTARFWESDFANNLWGNIFGYFLILSAFFQFGADLQYLVNVFAYFLLALVLGFLSANFIR